MSGPVSRPVSRLAALQPEAQRHWRKTDPVMARLSAAHRFPPEPPVSGTSGFAELVRSIIHQQVSMAAARTITDRTVKVLGGQITPRRILNRTPDQLRGAGLSTSKVAYILDLADKTARGDVEFGRFPTMSDEAILDELVAVKGIGTWTAKMFLIFHLERPDVCAPEDLGLRASVSGVYGVDMEEAGKFMLEHQAAWSPYNSVAARVLWQAHRVATGRDKTLAAKPSNGAKPS